jgi:hypothetical protein
LDNWDKKHWENAMHRNEVLVGTPEVFRKALVDKAFISPIQFSLMVFDECHNAVGKSPMASIMRDAVLRSPEAERPRILGLTASFVSGSTSSKDVIVKKRKEMEVLFQANMFSPHIPAVEQQDKYSIISYPADNLNQFQILVEDFVRNALPKENFEDLNKWVAIGWNIFNSLGAEALRLTQC